MKHTPQRSSRVLPEPPPARSIPRAPVRGQSRAPGPGCWERTRVMAAGGPGRPLAGSAFPTGLSWHCPWPPRPLPRGSDSTWRSCFRSRGSEAVPSQVCLHHVCWVMFVRDQPELSHLRPWEGKRFCPWGSGSLAGPRQRPGPWAGRGHGGVGSTVKPPRERLTPYVGSVGASPPPWNWPIRLLTGLAPASALSHLPSQGHLCFDPRFPVWALRTGPCSVPAWPPLPTSRARLVRREAEPHPRRIPPHGWAGAAGGTICLRSEGSGRRCLGRPQAMSARRSQARISQHRC